MTWGTVIENLQQYARMIIETFGSLFKTFALTPINERLADIANVDQSVLNMLDFLNIGELTTLELIIGVGLPIILVWQFITWVLNIVT